MPEPVRETVPPGAATEVRPESIGAPPSGPARILPFRIPRKAGGTRAASLTVITPIARDQTEPLRQLLERIDLDECRQGKCPLPGVKGIHVMRWVILPAQVRNSGLAVPEQLVLWTMFDGTTKEHLRALVLTARDRLDQVYSHCEGYPVHGGPKEIESFLSTHGKRRAWSASFDGTPARSVEQIEAEADLCTRLTKFLDQDWGDRSKSHVYLEAKAWVKGQADLQWALSPPSPPQPPRLVRWLVAAAAAGAVALCAAIGPLNALLFIAVMLGVGVVSVAAWMYGLSRAEKRAKFNFVAPDKRWLEQHASGIGKRENEDFGVNRMTILTDVQPGFIRAVTMRVVLTVINLRARAELSGRLHDVETIHFAQWRLVDRARRLLFMSNYDGRADEYFKDFSNNAAPGVNAIWSNTVGFPPTTLLIGNGSRNLPSFQDSARAHQIVTDVWYLGYTQRTRLGRQLTTRRINDNTQVREGLSRALTPPEVERWLNRVFNDGTSA